MKTAIMILIAAMLMGCGVATEKKAYPKYRPLSQATVVEKNAYNQYNECLVKTGDEEIGSCSDVLSRVYGEEVWTRVTVWTWEEKENKKIKTAEEIIKR